MEFLETEIAALDEQIAEQLQPFAKQVELLGSLPGIDQVTAATILGEIGVDMTRFPTAPQLASWAGLCPGNYESAGTHKGGRSGLAMPPCVPRSTSALGRRRIPKAHG